jgi:hypothetical protein
MPDVAVIQLGEGMHGQWGRKPVRWKAR